MDPADGGSAAAALLLRFLELKPDTLAIRLVLRTSDEVAAAAELGKEMLEALHSTLDAVRKDSGTL